MKLFRKKESKAVRREDAIAHLSEKFNIPAEDMSATFEKSKSGWRAGKPEAADTLTITVKQPLERPNLHHDMQQELKQVFEVAYGPFNPKAMKFYFGVAEDREHTKKLNDERRKLEDNKEAIVMAPELS